MPHSPGAPGLGPLGPHCWSAREIQVCGPTSPGDRGEIRHTHRKFKRKLLMTVCPSLHLETSVVFVIPRPSKVIPQRVAASTPRHPARPGPVGARPPQTPPPRSPLPSGPSRPGSRQRRPWAPPLPIRGPSWAFGPLGPSPTSPLEPSPAQPAKAAQGSAASAAPAPGKGRSALQPPAPSPRPARSRPPPLGTGSPRGESRSPPHLVPRPRALRSPLRLPPSPLSSPAALPRSSPVLPSSVPPGRRAPEPFRRPALRPPVPRLRTSGSPPPPPPSLPPPAAPSRPLASLRRAPWDGRTELGSGGLRPPCFTLRRGGLRSAARELPGSHPGVTGLRRAGTRPGLGSAAALRSGKRRLSRRELNFTGAGSNPAAPSALIPPALPRRGHLCGVRLGVLSPGGRRTLRSGAGSLCIRFPTGPGSAVCRAPQGRGFALGCPTLRTSAAWRSSEFMGPPPPRRNIITQARREMGSRIHPRVPYCRSPN